MPAVPALTRLLGSHSHQQQMLAFDSILAISDEKMVLLPIVVQSLQRKDEIGGTAALYVSLRHPEQAESLGVSNIFRRMKYFGSNGVAMDPLPAFK